MALGYPGQLAIDKACETEAEGLLDSVLVCLSDDPPIPVRPMRRAVRCSRVARSG